MCRLCAIAEIGICRLVFTPPKILGFFKISRFLLGFGYLLASFSAFALSQITITAAQVTHPQIEAKNVALHVQLGQEKTAIKLQSETKTKAFEDWVSASLQCDIVLANKTASCDDGLVKGLIKNAQVNIPFSIKINRLYQNNALDLQGDLHLRKMRFSDASGLHAAENIDANIGFFVSRQGEQLAWETQVNWIAGELFWQPYFVESGHQLKAKGTWQSDVLNITQANLTIHNVGALNLDGEIDVAQKKILALNADFPHINLATAYPLLFKPALEKTAFNHAHIDGKAALKLTIKDHTLMASSLQLKDVNIADNNGKFAFYHLNADIPWSYETPQQVKLSYQNGMLLNMPLGVTNLSAEVNRYAVTAPNIKLPILDGALNLSDVSAARIGQKWYWHLRAKLEPISMADLSEALKLPRMSGQASAEIPLVTYNDGVLTNDGELVLNVFNGTAKVRNLVLQNPLGVAPKLFANMTLRNLDLGELTRTFSFGAMEGKLDGDIANLEMQNWKPVKFDAEVKSSPGKYPKKISQRAVENISALGGAGAAAAIQRSVLRFFEQFHYEKLGLSCQLRNDICKMAGVESTAQGYIIVKGSGIPAITVMGYNQTVGWADLLARLNRVIAGNSQAVIK